MSRRPRLEPEITCIKLNPEQAVLSCGGYNRRQMYDSRSSRKANGTCNVTSGKRTGNYNYSSAAINT